MGGILDAVIFMKILTPFCPLFSCFWLRNHQHFQQSSWFSKSLWVTWPFPMIWCNSGHINFYVNFAPCFSSFIVVLTPKPAAFPTSKIILIISVGNLTFSIYLVEFLDAFICMKILTTSCPLFSCFWLRNHQHFQQSSWFSKSLLLTWPFLLIWWNSGHINFHVNFAPCLSFFIVVWTPNDKLFQNPR